MTRVKADNNDYERSWVKELNQRQDICVGSVYIVNLDACLLRVWIGKFIIHDFLHRWQSNNF